MRRSASVRLVLLPMLATAAVASVAAAQPGPQDGEPVPDDQGQDGQINAPGMTDPDISPPGMTPVVEGLPLCDEPETWPEANQELGVPPDACRAPLVARCNDPATWDMRSRELGIAPDGCVQQYGVYGLRLGYWGPRGRIVRGGFGGYFGTGGG